MSKPLVAVVGRPNVGKSTLFNKLIGSRLSIVDDTPGVTRDRIYAPCEWCGHKFMLVDTGGIEPYSQEIIPSQIRAQAELAIELCDVICLVTSMPDGVTAADSEVASMLHKSGKPVVLCVNKCDGVGEVPAEFYEFYNLGIGDPIAVSAVHGHGTGDLLDEICKSLPSCDEEDEEDDAVKVAVIGKPNAGKSSLVNRIAGEQRSIVSDIAGTTRDMVEETVMVGDIPLLLVDTAGIRETDDVVEKIGVGRAKKSINDSDLNILILDASQPLTAEDLEIMKLCDASKTIVVLNKIDLGMKINPGDLSSFSGRIVEMSALNYEGEEEFRAMLQKVVAVSEVEPSEALISNERQFTAMKRAFEMVDSAAEDLKSGITLDAVTVLIQNAVSELMSLTGENVNIETVNKIFSKFCVGK